MEGRTIALPPLAILAIACARLRSRLGLTQERLAELAGLSQGAISHFESAHAGFLSEDSIRALFRLLGQDPEALPEDLTRAPAPPAPAATRLFCDNPDCPTALPYHLGPNEVAYRPVMGAPAAAARCPFCGRRLRAACPSCKRPLIAEGGFCAHEDCGRALVRAADIYHERDQARAWSAGERAWRQEILQAGPGRFWLRCNDKEGADDSHCG